MFRTLLVAILATAFTALSAFPSKANDSPNPVESCCKQAPELWVLNSRCAPKCQDLDAGFDQVTYHRFDLAERKFVLESRETFLAAQVDIPTLLFSHGNTLEHDAAMKSCWKVYQRLSDCPGRKMLVFWSWPSEIYYNRPLLRPIELARVNIKTKYVFAERQGYYIAKLAQLMSNNQRLTLAGHSFGGVTVVVAAHFLAGGSLESLSLEDRGEPKFNLGVAVISGALDCDALLPGHRYEKALDAVEKFYTTYSDRDATLKRWPTHSFRGQEALGYAGMCVSQAGANAHKIRQDRLTEDVGRSHYMTPHLASHKMVNALCEMAFDQSVGTLQRGFVPGRIIPGVGDVDLQRIIEVPGTLIFPGLAL